MAHSDKVIDHYDHSCGAGSLPKDDPNGGISLVGARRKRLHQEHEYRPRIQPPPDAILFDA